MAKKQTVAVIFFLMIFVLLTVYIAVRTSFIYKTTTGYADNTTATMDCVGYMYEIDSINYSSNNLVFYLRNQIFSKYDLNKIEIWTEENQKEIVTNTGIGSSKKIEIDNFIITDNFSIAPAGCRIYSKTYAIT